MHWSKTRPYALRLNAVYLTLAGREGAGIENPADAATLLAEIKAKWDPQNMFRTNRNVRPVFR